MLTGARARARGRRIGRQLAGDHDPAALVVALVEVDAVVVDRAVGAEPVGADAAAVLGREVAADVVAADRVAVGAGEDADAARQVGAGVGDDPVVGDPDVVVLVVGVAAPAGRACRCGCVAVGAAVVLDDVVRDLQVAGVGVGEDRAALGDQAAGLAGRVAADPVDVAREARLVAAADVEAVDRRRGIRAEARREGVAVRRPAGTGRSRRRHRRSGCRPRSARRRGCTSRSGPGRRRRTRRRRGSSP